MSQIPSLFNNVTDQQHRQHSWPAPSPTAQLPLKMSVENQGESRQPSRMDTYHRLKGMYPGCKYGNQGIPSGLHNDSVCCRCTHELDPANVGKADFRAYIRLQRLPINAPKFDLDDRRRPIVRTGEYICRIATPNNGQLCGEKTTGRTRLITHINKDHMSATSECLRNNDLKTQLATRGECHPQEHERM